MDSISPMEQHHREVADIRRLAQLYGHGPYSQALVEVWIRFTRWVDKINKEADISEDLRLTKLEQDRFKLEQEKLEKEKVTSERKPDDDLPGAAVKVDQPIKPITPARHEIPVEAFDERLVYRTQRLEIPAYKAEIPFFEVKKEFEVKQKTYAFKNEIPKEKGITI
jgi:hypothetical protein